MEFLQNVESIDVPTSNCSKFPLSCHPVAKSIVMEAAAWLRLCAKQTGCDDPDGDVEKLIDAKLALLACRFYPLSPDPKLTLIFAKIMIWFFTFDNVMDEPRMLGNDSVACQQFCGFILQAFLSTQSSEALIGVDLLPTRVSRSHILPTLALTMVGEWWAELRASMSARQQARFCSHLSDYVLVHARQARFKEEKKVPELEEYMQIRSLGGAMYVVEILAELDCGVELEEEELRNPSIRRLNEVMALYPGVLNDYVGFAHEYENGDYFNMLTVLHYQNNVIAKREESNGTLVPFQRTCREAWERIRVLEEECAACAKAVRDWACMRSKPGLLKYVDSLCGISAANWLHCVDSPRYTAFHERCLPSPEAHDVPMIRIALTPPILGSR